jgi:hypothetical protein
VLQISQINKDVNKNGAGLRLSGEHLCTPQDHKKKEKIKEKKNKNV